MGYSKRQFLTAAFTEIGMASYVFDLQPEDLESALRRLDSMMADWNGKGIRLAYPLPGSPQDSDLDAQSEVPDCDLDAQSEVPDSANEAIIANLATRLAPSYGKQVSPLTLVTAKTGYNTLLSRATMPYEQQFPGTLPSGAGNKPWRVYDDPFVRPPVDPVLTGPEGPLEFN